ncbi:hypothetical protein [Acetobacter cibinongensis]|nr:hypothetical protein [Acetobacter cibinongensis]
MAVQNVAAQQCFNTPDNGTAPHRTSLLKDACVFGLPSLPLVCILHA